MLFNGSGKPWSCRLSLNCLIFFSVLILLIAFSAALFTSYFGVGIVRRWSIANDIFDVPNERSSHTVPMPLGGGLVIVLIGLLSYVLISFFYSHQFAPGYFAGAILIALVSWIDDLYSIPVGLRLFTHSAAAIAVIWDLGFLYEIYVPLLDINLEVGTIGAALTFLWIVWMINAYNFMDGIDGIAASQAIIACTGWVLLGLIFGYKGVYSYGGILICVSFGFLIHNWQPAKIFMGDVGSSFLGFTLSVMPLLALDENAANAPIVALASFVFVWFFLFDTIFTFLLRLFSGKRFWYAHRDHIYQKLIISGFSHKSTTLLYILLSAISVASFIIWLDFRGRLDFLLFFIIAICTIVLVLITIKRGPIRPAN